VVRTWSHNPQYTHGFLVPPFALFLLWLRRRELVIDPCQPSWWGVLFVAAAVGLRLGGAFSYYTWLESLSLLGAIAGIFLTVGGRSALRWAWPSVLFLFFMLPLPYRIEAALGPALQRLTSAASAYALQTLGFCAVAEGTLIEMNGIKIHVIQACSGLSMLLTFFALSVGLALLLERPLRDKLLLVASAVPVALVVNIVRITVTGVCYKAISIALGNAVFHDLAGWLMMPLAMALLGLELYLLPRLLTQVEVVPLRVKRASFPARPTQERMSHATG
jgi:exosortase